VGRTGLLVTALGIAVCASACSRDLQVVAGDAEPAEAPLARNADGIAATLQQWREDEVKGAFQVKIHNGSNDVLTVDTLRVDWDGFASAASSAPAYRVLAGGRVDLAVPTVAARCSNPPSFHETFPDGPAVAVVNGNYNIPITDSEGVLDRMYASSCRQQAVAARVDLRFGDSWQPTEEDEPPALLGTIVVEPTADSTVAISGISGSVLLSLEPATDLSIVDGALPVIVGREGRCDAHALGESKKTYVFQVSLQVDDEPVNVDIAPTEAVKAQMYDVIARRCGL
jgi:hypothetical protein